jgi:hypothetical protein
MGGNWWCTVFGNDEQVLWREKPGVVRVEFEKGGRIRVARRQPGWLRAGEKDVHARTPLKGGVHNSIIRP